MVGVSMQLRWYLATVRVSTYGTLRYSRGLQSGRDIGGERDFRAGLLSPPPDTPWMGSLGLPGVSSSFPRVCAGRVLCGARLMLWWFLVHSDDRHHCLSSSDVLQAAPSAPPMDPRTCLFFFAQRRPQALQRVFGPRGPLRHSGESTVPQSRHTKSPSSTRCFLSCRVTVMCKTKGPVSISGGGVGEGGEVGGHYAHASIINDPPRPPARLTFFFLSPSAPSPASTCEL